MLTPTVKQLFYFFIFYVDEHYIIFGFHQTDFSLMPVVQFLFHILEDNFPDRFDTSIPCAKTFLAVKHSEFLLKIIVSRFETWKRA